MGPMFLLVVGASLLYLLAQKTSRPVANVPAPSGGTAVTPVSVTTASDGMGNESTYRLMTIDEFPQFAVDPPGVLPTASALIDDAAPPHALHKGDKILLIVTNDSPRGAWAAVPAVVIAEDPMSSIGYAVAQASVHVPGGPLAGTTFNLPTGQNENEAYLDPYSGGIDAFLSRHDQGGVVSATTGVVA